MVYLLILSAIILITIIATYPPGNMDFEPVREKYKIKYFKETMSENYFDILREISECTTEQHLRDVYTRMIIFQGSFKDSASFLSELVEAYHKKESSIPVKKDMRIS